MIRIHIWRQVTVYLDGHPIPSTPFGVKVGPAVLHAPACAVRGLRETCPFGMLEFEVHGRDAYANSLQLLPRYAGSLSRCLHKQLYVVLPCKPLHQCAHTPAWTSLCRQSSRL